MSCSSCWIVAPLIRSRLWREVSPAIMVIDDFGTLSCFARNSRQHWLAAPSTGGEVRRNFNSPSWIPQNWLREARGWTKTLKSRSSPSFDQGAVALLLFTQANHACMVIQQRLKLHFKLKPLATNILYPPLQISHFAFSIINQPLGQ